MYKVFKKHWIKILIFTIGLFFFGVIYGCDPKVKSLLHDDIMVTGPELKIELETLLSIAKVRQEDLRRQQELRNLILKNVLIIAQTGTLNPVSVLTALFAFYGVGSAATTTVKTVKKKIKDRN